MFFLNYTLQRGLYITLFELASFSICGLYYKNIMTVTIVSDACTINVSCVFALALASVISYARK